MDAIGPGEFERCESEGGAERDGARAPARLFDIPPGRPFLPTLVRSLCDGDLVPGLACAKGDPMALADATIYVPTRRAARELRAAFVTELSAGGTASAAILPRIRALGDVEDDAGFFGAAVPETLLMAPVIGDTERLIALTELTLAWIRRLPEHLSGLHGGASIEVPSSLADAVWLARDLMALMDEMEGQGTKAADLVNIDAGEHALWWQLTCEFLAIVTQAWPGVLDERDRSNPADHRNRAIRAEARRLREGRAEGPVVVAASPNMGPATVDLVRAVSGMERGAVVLPGLDRRLDENEFRALGTGDAASRGAGARDGEPGEPGHPQFGHARLLAALGASRADVRTLGADATRAGTEAEARERAVAEALRPSSTTHRWVETASDLADPAAFEGVEIVEAPGPREEAIAIAAALRRAVHEPGRTAALVTPDRALARRVASELRRFGIEADDSAGTPLVATPPTALLRLAIEAAVEPTSPYAVLGLLKHPLATLGLSRSVVRRATLLIEMALLRHGPPEPIDVLDLAPRFGRRVDEITRDPRQPHWWPRFEEGDVEEALGLCERLTDALRPLAEARLRGETQPPSVWAAWLAHTLDEIGREEDGGHEAIYGDAAGAALARIMREWMTADDERIALGAPELWRTLEALMSDVPVRPPVSGHPRVAILGLIESRLLSPDTVVLGGLNEGAWPRQTSNDAFLSRPMREVLALELPERRIGLEAHDFTMMMGAREVVLTRSRRADGSPTTPSRWLQRLRAVLPAGTWAGMTGRGEALLAQAVALDRPDEVVGRCARPEPRPPLDARPDRLSVTEIEVLRRDPYALYAKKVLGLAALPVPRARPDERDRGTLFHAIVERFVGEGVDPAAGDAADRLEAIAREAFEEAGLPDAVHALWWARFETMAPHYLAWERGRAGDVADSFPEAWGRIEVAGITLTGKADRIDVMADGRVEIIDYKTGTEPSTRQAKSLVSPQLPIEAAMIARGGFRDPGKRPTASMAYVRLRPGEGRDGRPKFRAERVESAGKTKEEREAETADEVAARAWHRLEELLALFARPETPYASRLMPFREREMDGDYDHLARAREWGRGGEDDADGPDGDDAGGDE